MGHENERTKKEKTQIEDRRQRTVGHIKVENQLGKEAGGRPLTWVLCRVNGGRWSLSDKGG
ncbi:MAG: hypothetical protein JSV88_04720 [Candidatus Aminicenantes bacterium]|nr:MAG: hypothetical protein JSV88_04720 [Candidatus Aminicenantes bacterium]